MVEEEREAEIVSVQTPGMEPADLEHEDGVLNKVKTPLSEAVPTLLVGRDGGRVHWDGV